MPFSPLIVAGPFDDPDVGHLGQPDEPRPAVRVPGERRDEDLADRLLVLAEGPGVADADGVALAALDRRGRDRPAQGRLDRVVQVAHATRPSRAAFARSTRISR